VRGCPDRRPERTEDDHLDEEGVGIARIAAADEAGGPAHDLGDAADGDGEEPEQVTAEAEGEDGVSQRQKGEEGEEDDRGRKRRDVAILSATSAIIDSCEDLVERT
jgi:hypothetical protein